MAHIDKNENGVIFLNDSWHIEDIQSIREDLSDEQAIEVLKYMAQNFDAENGINWDFIAQCSFELYPDNEGD